MKRILKSIGVIAAMSVIVIGATNAYFTDVETSTENVFEAGGIDMKIDFDGYYNQAADGTPNAGSWDEKDLEEGVDKFFDFEDLKPGDYGEGTISLHVYDNDAWGRMVIEHVVDSGDTCTDPETKETAENDADCSGVIAGADEADGELRENLTFYAWLDQGAMPGFQNIYWNGSEYIERVQGDSLYDAEEGDNIWQGEQTEPTVITEGTIDAEGEIHNFWEGLSLVWSGYCSGYLIDGDNNYDYCHGIAQDGRLVGSTTYYLGIAWKLPEETGNEAQTDSLGATIKFEAMQYRNVPTPFPVD